MTILIRLRWRNEDKGCGDAFLRVGYLKGGEVLFLVLQSSIIVTNTQGEVACGLVCGLVWLIPASCTRGVSARMDGWLVG